MLNILTEPLIRYRSLAGNLEASLPGVYAALMADEVIAFPALRPHQRHAWHSFLVQLGAMAMHRAGLDTPPETAEEWAELIRGLTSDFPEDEPWQYGGGRHYQARLYAAAGNVPKEERKTTRPP